MAYCDQSDIEMRISAKDLVLLADQDGDGAADPDVVAAAISNACDEIDSYLSLKFRVPVSPVPHVLLTRAVSLSVYYLRLGRDSVTDDVRKQYEADIKWLQDVVAQKVQLGLDLLPLESPHAPTVNYETRRRIFGRDEPL